MDSENSLRSRIRSMIKPWLKSVKEEPPFSAEQLVVMALVDQDLPLTPKAVYDWIYETFPFYSTLARELMWTAYARRPTRPHATSASPELIASDVLGRLNAAFLHFDIPITRDTSDKGDHWTVSIPAARAFLKPVLDRSQQEDNEPFPFLLLPSELRTRIYEMVLTLPPVGIRIARNALGEMQITTTSIDLLRPGAQRNWSDRYDSTRRDQLRETNLNDNTPIKCQSPPLLSLLQVCRLIHNDAMPVFFETNLFVFLDITEMFDFFTNLSRTRRKHVRRVLLRITIDARSHLQEYSDARRHELVGRQIETRNACEGLTELNVLILSGESRELPIYGPRHIQERHPSSKMTIAEIKHLIKLFRNLEHCQITFRGDNCAAFETELADRQTEWQRGRDMICS